MLQEGFLIPCEINISQLKVHKREIFILSELLCLSIFQVLLFPELSRAQTFGQGLRVLEMSCDNLMGVDNCDISSSAQKATVSGQSKTPMCTFAQLAHGVQVASSLL